MATDKDKFVIDIQSFQKLLSQTIEPVVSRVVNKEVARSLAKFIALDGLLSEPGRIGYPVGTRGNIIPKGSTSYRLEPICDSCYRRFPIAFKFMESIRDIFRLGAQVNNIQPQKTQTYNVIESFYVNVKLKSFIREQDGTLVFEFYEPLKEDIIVLVQYMELIDA